MEIIENENEYWFVSDKIKFLRKKKISEHTILAWLTEFYHQEDFNFYLFKGKVIETSTSDWEHQLRALSVDDKIRG